MTTTDKAYAQIFAEIMMVDDEGNAPRPGRRINEGSIVNSLHRLKGKGWAVSLVVKQYEDSLTFSVQFPGGRYGYTTDILNQFLSEETVRAYAEHALKTIIKKNEERDEALRNEALTR